MPTIRGMLQTGDIRLLTPEEQAAQAAKLREQEELEYQRLLEKLDEYELECERGGRPPIVLPQEVARRVLADVEAGHAHRAIVRKYHNTPWRFSRRWLERALANGTLAQMAGVAHLAGQNAAKRGPVFATI